MQQPATQNHEISIRRDTPVGDSAQHPTIWKQKGEQGNEKESVWGVEEDVLD